MRLSPLYAERLSMNRHLSYNFLHPTQLLQAAAAERLVGKDNIFDAAKAGDTAVIRDHLLVDPACVHLKGRSNIPL